MCFHSEPVRYFPFTMLMRPFRARACPARQTQNQEESSFIILGRVFVMSTWEGRQRGINCRVMPPLQKKKDAQVKKLFILYKKKMNLLYNS